MHLGASFSLRDLDGAVFEIESNGEVHGAPDVLDTELQADSSISTDESAWISNRLALIGEVYIQDVSGVVEMIVLATAAIICRALFPDQ